MSMKDTLLVMCYAPQAISWMAGKFGTYNLSIPNLLYHGGQALISHQKYVSPELYRKMEKINSWMTCLDLVSIFWGFGNLVNAIEKKYRFFDFSKPWDLFSGIVKRSAICYATFFISLGVGIYAVRKLGQIFGPPGNPKKMLQDSLCEGLPKTEQDKIEANLKNVSLIWNQPLGKEDGKLITLSHLVINVGLFILSENRFSTAVNASLVGFRLYKQLKEKWLEYKVTYLDETRMGQIEKLNIYYRCFLYPFQNKSENPDCGVCLDTKPISYFCSKHAFHDVCIMGSIYSASQKFIDHFISLEYQKNTVWKDNKKYVTCSVQVPTDKLPSCPSCRERPEGNHFNVDFKPFHENMIGVRVNVI